MAQYKVPQDVEADDKLLGPFSFRQFVYLLIAGGLIALMVALFQLFPLLALIPLPFVLLLGALALPLKKDQPMETYLAAIVSYYLKPRVRRWTPGQRDTTIAITAPKKVEEETRTRDITSEEATHRLSFLADIMDTEGYSIKGAEAKRMDEDLVAEANKMNDIFETNHYDNLESILAKDENARHEKVMQEMREEIINREENDVPGGNATAEPVSVSDTSNGPSVDMAKGVVDEQSVGPNFNSAVVVQPDLANDVVSQMTSTEKDKKNMQKTPKPSIIELANNPDYSVATISKEAKRIKERDEGEVFISLHQIMNPQEQNNMNMVMPGQMPQQMPGEAMVPGQMPQQMPGEAMVPGQMGAQTQMAMSGQQPTVTMPGQPEIMMPGQVAMQPQGVQNMQPTQQDMSQMMGQMPNQVGVQMGNQAVNQTVAQNTNQVAAQNAKTTNLGAAAMAANQKMPISPNRDIPTSTQSTLLISELRDNVVIMKDGSFRAVVACKSINFDLMSEMERESVEYSYQNFLNSLKFTTQILIRSQRVDIGPYLERLSEIRRKNDNMLLGVLMDDYINFVDILSQEANIMDKSFFIVIPYYTSVDAEKALEQTKNFFKSFSKAKAPVVSRIDRATYEKALSELTNRVDSVTSGLFQIGIHSVRLNTKELAELYYNFNNPDTAIREPLVDFSKLATMYVRKGEGEEPKNGQKEEATTTYSGADSGTE